jgi:hypothetical protein
MVMNWYKISAIERYSLNGAVFSIKTSHGEFIVSITKPAVLISGESILTKTKKLTDKTSNTRAEAISILKEHGYDGIIQLGEEKPSIEPFFKNQVKRISIRNL